MTKKRTFTPEELQYIFQKGVKHHQSNELDQARACYHEVLEADQGHAETLHLLGVLYHQKGESEKGMALIQRAIEIKPNNANYYSNLGSIFSELKEVDKAIAVFDKALSIDQKHIASLFNIALAYAQKGEYQRSIVAFQQAIKLDPNHYNAISRMGALLQSIGKNDEAKKCYDRAIEIKDDYYMPYNNRGLIFSNNKEYEQAISDLEMANQLKPDDPEVLCNLGGLYQKMERFDDAINVLKRSIEIDPSFIGSYNNLGAVYLNILDYKHAEEYFKKTLELDPIYQVEHNMGIMFQRQRRYDEATEHYKLALEKDPKSYNSAFNITCIKLMQQGHTPELMAEYENRFFLEDCKPRPHTYPRWEGQSLKGKSILLTGDQGIGDELQFCSMVQEICDVADKVYLETNYRFVTLFKRSFPDLVGVYPTTEPITPELQENHYDYQCPMGSLPQYLRLKESDYPKATGYVKPNPDEISSLRETYLAGTKKKLIGVSWYTKNSWNGYPRRITLQELVPLMEIENAIWVSLQYGDHQQELLDFAKETGHEVIFDESVDSMQDLDRFAAQVAAMDRVISIDNATVHMAGALGVPIWTLVPYGPDWRWMLDREDSPWYPTMKLWRQDKLNIWDSVIERMVPALKKECKAK